jgi:hypothetical protein
LNFSIKSANTQQENATSEMLQFVRDSGGRAEIFSQIVMGIHQIAQTIDILYVWEFLVLE